MHIAASSPLAITKDDLKKEVLEKELEIIKLFKKKRNDRKDISRQIE